MIGGKSVANTSPYGEIYSGRRRAYACSTAAWRLSAQASPADATAYVTVAANQQVLLPRGIKTYARGESGTVTVNVIELDPPV